MGRKTTFEMVEDYYQIYGDRLEFRSGKWFLDKKEVKNMQQWLLRSRLFDNLNQVDKFIETYIAYTYDETKWKWYDPPILEEARNLKELKPLCYPLTKKQLVIINYLLRHDEEVFFILTGVGGSGKSTFANIICQIFEKDRASLTLTELGEDFKLATGIDKRLIYSTEINADEINNGKIKQLVSNEEMTINPKNLKPYRAVCQSAFFFNCNKPPKLDLSDTGMLRRILYYNMNTKIQNPDPTLNKKEWSHADMVNVVAHALKEDMTDFKKLFEDETRELLVSNNNVWLNINESDYESYNKACHNKGYKPFNEQNWEAIRDLIINEWKMTEKLLSPVSIAEQKEIDPIFWSL